MKHFIIILTVLLISGSTLRCQEQTKDSTNTQKILLGGKLYINHQLIKIESENSSRNDKSTQIDILPIIGFPLGNKFHLGVEIGIKFFENVRIDENPWTVTRWDATRSGKAYSVAPFLRYQNTLAKNLSLVIYGKLGFEACPEASQGTSGIYSDYITFKYKYYWFYLSSSLGLNYQISKGTALEIDLVNLEFGKLAEEAKDGDVEIFGKKHVTSTSINFEHNFFQPNIGLVFYF